MIEKLKQPYLWLCLLTFLHLPMVAIHYSRLWSYEHYQFFPFALGCFGWLVATRRLKGSFKLSVAGSVFLTLDLPFVVAGVILNSPWLVCIGAICLCCCICLSLRDSLADSSLAYLVLLPLITIRLPLSMDTQVIQWLQKATTRVASDLLNYFGYLHLREGNILEFPGKRFLVEEACSGVQSLFTLLFLAALIVCGYRRKWLHSILVLASAFCFAGLMNVIRVASVSMAWFSLNVDLSSGWQHDAIGYAALVIAAMLVFSTDAFLNLVCAPVPDIPSGGVSAAFLNPLTAIWNWLFLVRLGQQEDDHKDMDESEEGILRPHPGFLSLTSPRNIFGWSWNFSENWFLSREPKLLMSAVPFLVAGLGGAGFMGWLQTSSDKPLVEMYEVAEKKAADADDVEAQKVYLNSLVRLRPSNLQHRFELAMLLLKAEDTSAGLSQIQMMTQPGPNDSAMARIWLARQAFTSEPLVPLELPQIEHQLLAALELQPKNFVAKELLVEVLLRKGQRIGAETQLLEIVDQNPKLLLTLIRLQKTLGRSKEQLKFHIEKANSFFEQELLKEPRSIQNRINLAELLLQTDQIDEAARVLIEGLADNDAPEFRNALAVIYSQLAVTKLRESALNREACSELIAKSLKLAPENSTVVSRALSLVGMGVEFQPDDFDPSIELLKSREERSNEEELMLVRALAANSQIDEAIERLQPLAEGNSTLRIIQAKLFRAAGQTDQLESLVENVVRAAESSEDEQTLSGRLDVAEVLAVASRFADSLKLLDSLEQDVQDSAQPLQRWKILFRQAMLATFDQKREAEQFQGPDEAIGMLDQILRKTSPAVGVLERLVSLSLSDDQFAKPAEQALNRLLVSGSANAEIYGMIGSRALQSNQVAKARQYLERAHNMSRANPLVLNNLALALVRGEVADPDRALRLANEALEIIPAHPDVLSTRAEVYVAMQRWEDARGDLESTLPKRPDSVTCHTLLAQVCEELGDLSLAEAHRSKVEELSARPQQDTSTNGS